MAARLVWKAALRSVAMISSQTSVVMSRNGPTWVRPALLTRPSMRPKRSMTAADEGHGLGAVPKVGLEGVGLGRHRPRCRSTTWAARSAASW